MNEQRIPRLYALPDPPRGRVTRIRVQPTAEQVRANDPAGLAGLIGAVEATENNPRGILHDPIWDRIHVVGDGCWEWTAGRNSHGYGHFRRGGKDFIAHRFVATLIYGPLPSKVHVCHTCDNPPCCRPDHLFLGTAKQNRRDCAAKGRSNPKHTLYRSWLRAQAIPLARLYQSVGSYHKMAKMLHVSHLWLKSFLEPLVDALPTRFGGVTREEYAARRQAGLMWCSGCDSWQPDNGYQSYCRPCCNRYQHQRKAARRWSELHDPAAVAGLVGQVPPTAASPRGIAVTHRGEGDHSDCSPNIALVCSACQRTVVLCTATRTDVEAHRVGQWRCEPCSEEGRSDA